MSKRILLIDDERLVLERAADALKAVGYDVVTSSEPGLPDGIVPETIDLVLLDINMPAYYGDDLIPVLPELGVHAPVYLYSSEDERRLSQIAERSGAAGVLSKKLTFTQMAAEVVAILDEGRA